MLMWILPNLNQFLNDVCLYVILSFAPVTASVAQQKYHPEEPKDNNQEDDWFMLYSVIITIWFQHSSLKQLSVSWFVVSSLVGCGGWWELEGGQHIL